MPTPHPGPGVGMREPPLPKAEERRRKFMMVNSREIPNGYSAVLSHTTPINTLIFFSVACGLPSAWRALRPPPCALRFSATPTRGSAPGAHVLEPLHLTPDLCARPGCRSLFSILYSLSSFLVLLCVWLRSCGRFTSPTPSMSPRGIFNKSHPSLTVFDYREWP